VAELRADGIAHAFGWVDDMPGLMHACDVLVQNAGGLTSLEALASGVPVVTYECLPGHGRTNAAALDNAGWAVWVRDRADLAGALARALGRPPAPAFARPSLALTIMSLAGAALGGRQLPGRQLAGEPLAGPPLGGEAHLVAP
jgi:UDP-N-acetylglucosamine:LPS N-acetylglucosamine transferase